MSWVFEPSVSLEIVKISSNPDITNDNACYSLEGAIFDVFNSANEKIGSVTTDAGGKGRLDDIVAGSGFYLVEQQPPKGYAKENERISFDIRSGETTTVNVQNKPQGDPTTILLQKHDADTDTNQAQGGLGLADAHFTIKYYKGQYTSADQLSGATPVRTWTVKTNSVGVALLHPDYVVAGDPLYYDSTGRIPTLPLGTISIQETKAPTGYLINDELFIRTITSSGVLESVSTYNEPIVKENADPWRRQRGEMGCRAKQAGRSARRRIFGRRSF
jgi:uncharacterized surface anchored protein